MDEFKQIPLNQIKTKSNYRKTFHEKSLKELAESIKENGVLEPIIVRQNGKAASFEVIAGERRVRASHLAGLATIPAIVKEVADKDFLKLQLIENIQREGVQFMEEAFGLRDLREKCDMDTSELARFIGKSQQYIDLMLKLTVMAKEAQEAARNGELLKSVAVHIARLPSVDNQIQMARDLRRTRKDKLISEWGARTYIQQNFSDSVKPKKQRNTIQKQNGNDFQANWKKYLVNFSCEQFENFKSIVRGRTDTQTLSEAVDLVMRKVE